MRSNEHLKHIASRVSHINCDECRADCERQFVFNRPFKYAHVHEYLTYVRPRLAAIKAKMHDGDSANARQWYRDFMRALENRIASHIERKGRKYAPGYLERLEGMRKAFVCRKSQDMDVSAFDFRSYARRGASTL